MTSLPPGLVESNFHGQQGLYLHPCSVASLALKVVTKGHREVFQASLFRYVQIIDVLCQGFVDLQHHIYFLEGTEMNQNIVDA